MPCSPHNYTFASEVYNKAGADQKSYRVLVCTLCGDTKEIVVADRLGAN